MSVYMNFNDFGKLKMLAESVEPQHKPEFAVKFESAAPEPEPKETEEAK